METARAAMMGGMVTACAFAAVLFVTFWRRSHDRFHLLFAVAMALLGCNGIGVLLVGPTHEAHSEVHLLRLAGFLVILAAIFDKNRRSR